ncbi:MAG: hypothetical protein DMG09_06065 [Acidobacteria bacterium]|nr:MAG: hypothetical protein DMG09_06065 [Acidobacteriota bacterium]
MVFVGLVNAASPGRYFGRTFGIVIRTSRQAEIVTWIVT